MKKEHLNLIGIISLLALIMLAANSCMMMGMKMGETMMGSMMSVSTDKVRMINTGQAVDKMIENAISDLSSQNLDINSVAVWRIKSQTTGLNVEVIRQKLVTQLVNKNLFKVVTRERLNELLEEQSLSLSGAIDEKSAVEIGNLIGVAGFIDGYASIKNNRFTLSFTLIEAKSGVIVWAKTFEQTVQL